MVDGSNSLVVSFVEDTIPFEQNDWRKMANAWYFVEDNPLVADEEEDAELEIYVEDLEDTCVKDEDGEVGVAVVASNVVNNGRRKENIGAV